MFKSFAGSGNFLSIHKHFLHGLMAFLLYVGTPPLGFLQAHSIAFGDVSTSINRRVFVSSPLGPPWDTSLPNLASHVNGVMETTPGGSQGAWVPAEGRKSQSGTLQRRTLREGPGARGGEGLPLGRPATRPNTVTPHFREIKSLSGPRRSVQATRCEMPLM